MDSALVKSNHDNSSRNGYRYSDYYRLDNLDYYRLDNQIITG